MNTTSKSQLCAECNRPSVMGICWDCWIPMFRTPDGRAKLYLQLPQASQGKISAAGYKIGL